jgi:hypothetical protein
LPHNSFVQSQGKLHFGVTAAFVDTHGGAVDDKLPKFHKYAWRAKVEETRVILATKDWLTFLVHKPLLLAGLQ